jgi:hypothetical protein
VYARDVWLILNPGVSERDIFRNWNLGRTISGVFKQILRRSKALCIPSGIDGTQASNTVAWGRSNRPTTSLHHHAMCRHSDIEMEVKDSPIEWYDIAEIL